MIENLELHDVIDEIADDLATAGQWQFCDYAPGPEDEYYWEKHPGA